MENTSKKTLEGMCESCMMPFNKDIKGADREHEKYCSYCYTGGGLSYPATDVREFKKAMVEHIVARGESRFMANIYAFMSGFAPRWQGNTWPRMGKGQGSFLGKKFGKHAENCLDKK